MALVGNSSKLPAAVGVIVAIGTLNIVAYQLLLLTAYNHEGNSADSRSRSCRKLPDTLIIGFEKCGTMTFQRFLCIHPRIFRGYDGFFGNRTRTLQDYERRKPCTPRGRLRIAKMDLAGTPSKVHKYRKDMKLLAIVRDPIERSISSYLHRLAKGDNLSSFDEFTNSYVNSPDLKDLGIISSSLYFKHLDPWLQVFPRSQFHIVDGDKFSRDPAGELRKAERFLGVKAFITNDHFVYNKEKGFYCLMGEDGCMGDGKGRPHPKVSPQSVQLLKDFFEPHNTEFFKVFGNFSWQGPFVEY